jgi:hypothetical protein
MKMTTFLTRMSSSRPLPLIRAVVPWCALSVCSVYFEGHRAKPFTGQQVKPLTGRAPKGRPSSPVVPHPESLAAQADPGLVARVRLGPELFSRHWSLPRACYKFICEHNRRRSSSARLAASHRTSHTLARARSLSRSLSLSHTLARARSLSRLCR